MTSGEQLKNRGEGARLANVFVLELRVLALELGAVGVSGQGFEHTADRQSHVANARHFDHAGRVGRDAVLTRHGLKIPPCVGQKAQGLGVGRL